MARRGRKPKNKNNADTKVVLSKRKMIKNMRQDYSEEDYDSNYEASFENSDFLEEYESEEDPVPKPMTRRQLYTLNKQKNLVDPLDFNQFVI